MIPRRPYALQPGDLVLTRGDLDPTGHHFIPYHTVCLVLGPPQGLEHDPIADAKVSILAANGVVADISKINLKLVSEGWDVTDNIELDSDDLDEEDGDHNETG